jgi:hypothetical protein
MMCGVPIMAVMRSYMKLIPFDFESFKHLISVSILFIEVSGKILCSLNYGNSTLK